MRVNYRLSSKELSGVPGEADWAESMGYDGVSSSETAHDPFLPLALAATATSRVTLATSVAIAFPRSPMVTAHTSRDMQDLSQGRFRLGLGTQVKGHIERRFSTTWEAPGPKLREYVQSLRRNCGSTFSPCGISGIVGQRGASWTIKGSTISFL